MIFDTVGKLGWSVSVRHHVIRGVVTDVLGADDIWWGDDDEADEGVGRLGDRADIGGKSKRNVPRAIIEEGCIVRFMVSRSYIPLILPQDCYKWEFGDYIEDNEPKD